MKKLSAEEKDAVSVEPKPDTYSASGRFGEVLFSE